MSENLSNLPVLNCRALALSEIELETQISVITQLAISFNNTNEYPKAVALLNYVLEEVKAGNLNQLFGTIYVAFSRVYRKLTEFPISRDHAGKALNYYRENGAWRGMAESYQTSPQLIKRAIAGTFRAAQANSD